MDRDVILHRFLHAGKKTLIDDEIEDISKKIISVVQEKLGGELRNNSQ